MKNFIQKIKKQATKPANDHKDNNECHHQGDAVIAGNKFIQPKSKGLKINRGSPSAKNNANHRADGLDQTHYKTKGNEDEDD